MQKFLDYLESALKLHKEGHTKEHAYRSLFHNFLDTLVPKDLQLIQEPTADKENRASPDFSLIKKTKGIVEKGSIIGYIETKKPDCDYWNSIETTDQIKKYLEITDNLLVSDYFNFKLITKKDDKIIVESVNFGSPKSFSLEGIPDSDYLKLQILLKKFFSKEAALIGRPKDLAEKLAARSKILKEYMLEELTVQEKLVRGELFQLYVVFRGNLSEELTKEEFVDAFAQMVAYSMFLAKLNSEASELITLENMRRLTNSNFALLSEMVKYLDILVNPRKNIAAKSAWLIKELLDIVNSIDAYSIGEKLAYNKQTEKLADPYLYFYEDFLNQYDKGTKVDRGVYYTPPEAVSYIVKSINKILKDELQVEDGLGNTGVKVLDFATGTGTFILEVYKEILEGLGQNNSKLKPLIREHILKNIYGFEYLMAPYAVAHLKLSEYLKSLGYEMDIKERIQVYLTNTLSTLHPQYDGLVPELSNEGEQSCRIKEEESLMVILGNPPYNSKSKNATKGTDGELNYIGKLLQDYKPIGETNIQPLNDDYIKFIRFAQDKLKDKEKGVIGVIVNNSFINGLTHRTMRNSLLKNFSSIYILNLHGSSRKKEKSKDGSKDENIFSIQQGVCIALFVKNGAVNGGGATNKKNAAPCKVYYEDLYGLKAIKKDYLGNNDYSTTKWQELDITKFNKEFEETQWAVQKVETSKLSKKAQAESSLFAEDDLKGDNKHEDYVEKSRFGEGLSFFVPMNEAGLLEYSKGVGINEIFKEYVVGIESQRDSLTIHYKKCELESVLQDLKNLDDEDIRKKHNVQDSRDWQLKKARNNVVTNRGKITNVLYRPFDIRRTYFSKDAGFVTYSRYNVMQHFLIPNMGISFIRHDDSITEYNHCLVSNIITDGHLLGSKNYTAPLYLSVAEEQKTSKLKGTRGKPVETFAYRDLRSRTGDNFSSYFKEYMASKYKGTYSPEETLGYIYALMYSKSYKEKYLEYLKIDFPRIIFADDENEFQRLSKLGQKLMDAHLFNNLKLLWKQYAPAVDSTFSGNSLPSPYMSGEDCTVIKANFSEVDSRLYINRTTYFSGVFKDVYDYTLHGKVLENFINKRKGKVLDLEDITHLENTIMALTISVQLEKEIG